tara:strand:- start:3186 stop:3809 length:624 start_codon:yes stop_codon:yes gene_type:complete
MRYPWVYTVLFLVLLDINIDIYSKDLGQLGIVYPIKEKSLLELIYQKLKQHQKEGNLGKLQEHFANKVKKSIEKPSAANIWSAMQTKRWLFDPSLTLKKDILNHEGVIVAKGGTTVNPLHYVKMSKDLIFINADNKKEIEFVKNKLKENTNNKIILVSGNIKDANKELQHPVYFDQAANLIKKFGIEHTPAVVLQKGEFLQIEELAL